MKKKQSLLLLPFLVITLFVCTVLAPFAMHKYVSDIKRWAMIIVFVPSLFTCVLAYISYIRMDEADKNEKGIIRKALTVELLTNAVTIGILCYALSALHIWRFHEIRIVRFIIGIILIIAVFLGSVYAFYKIMSWMSRYAGFEIRFRSPIRIALINIPITAVFINAVILILKG